MGSVTERMLTLVIAEYLAAPSPWRFQQLCKMYGEERVRAEIKRQVEPEPEGGDDDTV